LNLRPWSAELIASRALAMGAMRLSTAPDRDEARALETLHAAFGAGVTLLDTADAYCWDAAEAGHNERLIARALATWSGDASRVRVATKGGLTRPGGRWVADGRARHLAAACAASRRALGVPRIHLYHLHAPDPRTPLATSVRALAALQKDGLVEQIGLSNVSLGQLREALDIVPLAAVQVELGPWHDASLRGGVVELCAQLGILVLAHRPLGGAESRRRLAQDPVLRQVAERHDASPADVVLAWLRSLGVVPLPGPTRPETASALGRLLPLFAEDVGALDARFTAARIVRVPRESRRPPDTAPGDVVLVMGTAGAGKSTVAADLAAHGYERLNRDDAGGRLADLLPELDARLAAGRRRVVVDNTYLSRASRNAVVETAWGRGVPVRCLWMQTGLEDAQVNVVQRMLARHGRLLGPEEMKRAAREDPGVVAPGVLFRHRRELEPPTLDEGFVCVDAVPFERRSRAGFDRRALVFWYDGVVRRSLRGARTPRSPDDVVLMPGAREAIHRHVEQGWIVAGISWHPEVAGGAMTPAEVEATFTRTHELLGAHIDAAWCPHADGPPVCWCRKPLPGLGVALIERHRLDPARCVYVGRDPMDRAFARTLGFTFRDAAEVFGPAADPVQ
jgi:aryl-alcohol dehydrogenase-like predicted oxidoreductase/histidinol phosphatase-like enzyme/predicted kinase